MARKLSMSAALREALAQILRNDDKAFLIGEDIGVYGGAFKISRGFAAEFGDRRVIDTPISEAGIVSVSCGAALMGSRPIIEIMFMDFLMLAMDAVVNVAVKWEATYGGGFAMPLLIRCPAGAGRSYGPTHSQSFEGMLQTVPGLQVVCPATPADAAGLLLGAYESAKPTVFVEHKALYARSGPVPETLTSMPLGEARVLRRGSDVSLFAYGRQVPVAWAAAEALARQGVQAEVVDLRCIRPLDRATVAESLSRTGRGLSLEESPVAGGIGAELAAVAMSDAFDYLEAPFQRLGPKGDIIPCNKALEAACFPTVAEVAAAAAELANY